MKLNLDAIQLSYSYKDEILTLKFKGSNELKDVLLWPLIKKGSHHMRGKVFSGPYKEYMRQQFYLINMLDDILLTNAGFMPVSRIVLEGYSLGGVWCKFFALDVEELIQRRGYRIGLYCFTEGDPRCGDAEFASLFGEMIPLCERKRYSNDIVPCLPPKIFGYHDEPGQKRIGPRRHWWQFWTWFTDHTKY